MNLIFEFIHFEGEKNSCAANVLIIKKMEF